jgi:3-hydroxyacyl-[acyl-carrier-protein] dehydratase
MESLDIHKVLQYLPHRYPFLLVDKVLEIEKNKRIRAIKNVSINEPFFPGHFPQRPVMPGVLMVEALAQSAGILSFYSKDQQPDANTMYYFAGIDKARFKRPVLPGDQIVMEVTLLRGKADIYKYHALAMVDNEVSVEANLMSTARKIA